MCLFTAFLEEGGIRTGLDTGDRTQIPSTYYFQSYFISFSSSIEDICKLKDYMTNLILETIRISPKTCLVLFSD